MGFFDDHPHRHVLSRVERPARYAGPEFGAAPPRPGAEVRLVLAFPDLYEVGSSNLGLAILYRTAAAIEWVHVERAFAPWPDYAQAMRDRGLGLVSRESATPLGAFDVIGFSLQHELTYTTVLMMLDLAGLELRSRARSGSHPLVIAGGPASVNPEPLSEFVDAFAPGDGERALGAILREVRASRAAREGRGALLERLAGLGHVYVPSLYTRGDGPAGRRVVTGSRAAAPAQVVVPEPVALGREPGPLPVVPSVQAVFDRAQVEIARGCSGGCRFCLAGTIYRPVRERSPGEVIEAAVAGAIATGWDEVGLSSLSTADYPALGSVVGKLGPLLASRGIALSVASLRAYGLAPDVLAAIRTVRATGMTFAPEAGSERLRAVINKSVSAGDLLDALARTRAHGWQRAKLYFMMGLPGEREEDIEALADLIFEAGRAWRAGSRGRRIRLSASVSNFVPKPFTPFERERMLDPESLARRAALLRRLAAGSSVDVRFHDQNQSWIEGLLARGGAEMCDALEAAFRHGCRLDGWSEHFDSEAWRTALASAGVDEGLHAAAIAGDAPLPWDVIRFHVDREFLAGEASRALSALPTERCGSPDPSPCQECGAPCDPAWGALAGGDDSGRGLERAVAMIERAGAAAAAAWGEGTGGRHHVGLTFDRTGPAAWLGHRDVIRVVAQTLRRAWTPLRLSRGFTPRPRLVFRAALPVGVVGLGEEVCVAVTRPLRDPGALLGMLGPASPEGIEFTAAASLDDAGARLVGRGPAAVIWYVPVEGDGAEEAVCSILGAGTIPVLREHGDRRREVDLRPLIARAEVRPAGSVPELGRAGLDAGSAVVVLEARSREGRWIRPAEIVGILAGRGLIAGPVARRLVAGEVS